MTSETEATTKPQEPEAPPPAQGAPSPTEIPESPKEENRPPAPLGLSDTRFVMLRANLLKETRKKFLKLFKHTPDNDKRVLPDEMAIFLSLMVFEELKQIDLALLGQAAAIRAQHDPFVIFMKVMRQLVDHYHQMVAPQRAPAPPSAPEERP